MNQVKFYVSYNKHTNNFAKLQIVIMKNIYYNLYETKLYC